jgi:hypothetical protein
MAETPTPEEIAQAARHRYLVDSTFHAKVKQALMINAEQQAIRPSPVLPVAIALYLADTYPDSTG